jgi:hypothetical protein
VPKKTSASFASDISSAGGPEAMIVPSAIRYTTAA